MDAARDLWLTSLYPDGGVSSVPRGLSWEWSSLTSLSITLSLSATSASLQMTEAERCN